MSGRHSAGGGITGAVVHNEASPIVRDRGVLRLPCAYIAQKSLADCGRRRARGRHGLLVACRLMNGSLNSDQEWAAAASMVFICRQDRPWAGVSIRPDGDCALPSAPRSAGGQSLRTSTFASPPTQPHNHTTTYNPTTTTTTAHDPPQSTGRAGGSGKTAPHHRCTPVPRHAAPAPHKPT